MKTTSVILALLAACTEASLASRDAFDQVARSHLRRLPAKYCGDGLCHGSETCSSCPSDCGTCGGGPSDTQAPTQSPPVDGLCGFCESTLGNAEPTECFSNADCPSSSTLACNANCVDDVTGESCEGTPCNNNNDCTPNRGNRKGMCVTTTLADTCRMEFTCKPTQSPVASPTNAPITSNPTASPVTSEPTTEPTTASPLTSAPTNLPTLAPTNSPTNAVTVSPTTSPNGPGILGTGVQCSSDSDCESLNCVNGACYASSQCEALKHDAGSAFDTEQALLIFVGSGFDNVDSLRTEINNAFSVFEGYNHYSSEVSQYTALFSTSLNAGQAYCDYFCQGTSSIERLLCCDLAVTRSLAADCNPFGTSFHANVQTVVVHNDVKYGGAGYIGSNVATTSINASGPKVAIHELGHSMFELKDEYSTGSGNSNSPNCATSTCDKWSDLSGNAAVESIYGAVGCQAGCNGDSYFVGQVSFMEYLSSPVGAVNDRYTCCTYQMITKSMPAYCDVFDYEPGYLANFCQSNDHQSYGTSSYDPAPPMGSSNDDGGNYLQLGDATTISVDISGNDGDATSWNSYPAASGVFRRNKVKGDWQNPREASDNGKSQVYRVKVEYSSGKRETYFLGAEQEVDAPPEEDGRNSEDSAIVPVTSLDLVLDTSGDSIVQVTAKLTGVSKNLFD